MHDPANDLDEQGDQQGQPAQPVQCCGRHDDLLSYWQARPWLDHRYHYSRVMVWAMTGTETRSTHRSTTHLRCMRRRLSPEHRGDSEIGDNQQGQLEQNQEPEIRAGDDLDDAFRQLDDARQGDQSAEPAREIRRRPGYGSREDQ